jgi:hypothetical protein
MNKGTGSNLALISRKLTGEATETELQKLQEFIRENPGMQDLWN